MTRRDSSCFRPGPAALLALCLSFAVAGEPSAAAAPAAAAPVSKLAPLQVTIDLADVDLKAGELTLRMSRPAARVTLKAFGLSGAVLAEADEHLDATPAGSPIVVRWTPPEEAVARIEVYGYDVNDYFKGVAITPWSFEIPHEDVVFETDSAEIRPSEAGKLQASLAS